MEEKIKLGISRCLLGENVRYDGGHKLDHYLKETLGMYVDWVGVCPEVEYGLPVPREAMRLVGDAASPRLLTIRTKIDHTDGMKRWADKRLKELEKENLCGFIFKSRSPSSGIRGVKVYGETGVSSKSGAGIFGGAFLKYFPLLPAEDDGRLQDPPLRENFIERIFVYRRWLDFIADDRLLKGLVSFHTDHKLLLMAHSTEHYRELGKLVAVGKRYKRAELLNEYIVQMMDGLKLLATVKKNTNVLMHIMGYFRNDLSGEEKQELIEIINNYHKGLIPLIVPVTLLRHYVNKFDEPYLKRQYYLNPHPVELMLRNHV
ncbi:DUF1722 domain-containing protein [candidate division WS5 bacterium]|uniref:DUF1722 domain-containing protein n=1 Tax=candidate division WS5 bacterium TaxID=2093353 RepID=A0A419DD39_9BACT|nr:MAG: DUF1722 domain-containing protein [candidate division WS5 bacterium]